jgi:hypothetical protein
VCIHCSSVCCVGNVYISVDSDTTLRSSRAGAVGAHGCLVVYCKATKLVAAMRQYYVRYFDIAHVALSRFAGLPGCVAAPHDSNWQ